MGRLVLLLLLAFLMPGLAIPVPPALKALSNLHLSTSFTSHPSVVMKYSIHYIEQKVRLGKGLGKAWGLAVSRPTDGAPGTGARSAFQAPNACDLSHLWITFSRGWPQTQFCLKIPPPGTKKLLSVLAPYASVIDQDGHFESCSLRML